MLSPVVEADRARDELARLLTAGDYHSYAYSYPHKTAYRPVQPEVVLRDLWADEARDALFLYIHVPFCEQRCGFCNLFTQAQPRGGIEQAYVAAVERQAAVVADVLAPARIAQLAVGGGTPTFLSAPLLDRLLRVARRLGAVAVPTSVEVSPATLDAEKLAVLVAHGTTRVSMGVQSFAPAETRAVHRHQQASDVERALALLRDAVPVRNIDLIYGLPGQTAASLIASLDRALELGANELYLYPLYVRPLTVLGRKAAWSDARRGLYRAGREHLLARGLRQHSMRMFALPRDTAGPPARYRCQDDGMVGLGAGARSYTRALHYASRFAVAQERIREQIAAWVAQPDAAHARASHGFRLDVAEQRRRYVLLSLLDTGIDVVAYRARFAGAPEQHLPELLAIIEAGLATRRDGALVLTELGLERSDVLGHFLQSAAVRAARAAWVEA